MNQTRKIFFPNCKNIDLNQLLTPDTYQLRTRCRVEYDTEVLKTEYISYSIRPVKSLRVIESNSLAYNFKKADRSELNTLFDQKKEADDVLIVRNNLITDTSICNIALWNGKEWITPAKPLLHGTMREKLVQEEVIHPKDIIVSELEFYQKIRLFNAMIDFGEIELPVSAISIS